jgi:hypothetical protein
MGIGKSRQAEACPTGGRIEMLGEPGFTYGGCRSQELAVRQFCGGGADRDSNGKPFGFAF